MLTLKYILRPVADDDLERIAGFPQSREELFWMFPAAEYPLTAGQLREAVAARSDSMVVLCGGEVVAFANFYKVKPRKFCGLGNVIVAPSARGQGAATFLIAEMERQAVEKYAAREMSISCFNRNRAGIELYTKLGYSPYDIERRTATDGSTALLIKMRKALR